MVHNRPPQRFSRFGQRRRAAPDQLDQRLVPAFELGREVDDAIIPDRPEKAAVLHAETGEAKGGQRAAN